MNLTRVQCLPRLKNKHISPGDLSRDNGETRIHPRTTRAFHFFFSRRLDIQTQFINRMCVTNFKRFSVSVCDRHAYVRPNRITRIVRTCWENYPKFHQTRNLTRNERTLQGDSTVPTVTKTCIVTIWSRLLLTMVRFHLNVVTF